MEMKDVIEEAKTLEQNENIDIINLWKQETNIDNVWNEDENANIIDLWTPCEFHIDENYEYIPKEDTFFSICSDLLYYGIAYPILKLLIKMIYDLKIEGQENIENIAGGAISVSNHVLFLDCAMIGLAFKNKNIYYTTQEESFKIPFVRKLIKLLRAIPIPKSIENKKHFLKAIDEALKENKIIHVYPEAALWPYCKKIRNFKNGAFDMAVRNQVPIIPCVFTFREPTGIRKLFKRKPDVTLKILEPIESDSDKSIRQQVGELKGKVALEMKKEID